jgi:serine/threonine protein kinase
MSQQQDDEDEGTVIRPGTLASAVSPTITLPHQMGEAGAADSAEDGLSLRIGARVSEFEITRRIGEGGFSIVYLARDHSLDRTVALKEYMPSSLATRVGTTQVQPRSQRFRDTFEVGLRSFVNEAKLLAQFDHPALVKVYRFWEANGTAYMVMPFYQGATVKEAVRAMPQPPDEAWLLRLLAPLTEALLVIHAQRCYHRDIAPDNVILLASSGKPLLLDFGAARRVIGDMTQGLTVILKAGYAPVEQYAEIPGMKQGSWTDVYALAAVVYWAITGSTPPASVGRMMSDSFVPLATCAAGRYSARFLQTIDRALVVRPEHRTQTIEAFRKDLGLTDDGTTSSAAAAPRNDSDATVIRPIGPRAGPATVAQRASPSVSAGAAETQRPTRATPPDPPPPAVSRPGNEGSQPRHAAPRDASSRPASADDGEKKADSRRMVLVGSALGAAVVATGIWWAVRTPGAPSPGLAREGSKAIVPSLQPNATQGVAPTVAQTPGAAGPTAQPALPPTAPNQDKLPPAATDTALPIPAAPVSPVESVPDALPARAAKKLAPPGTGAAQPEQNPPRASQRLDAARAERAQADSANRAECGRIMQRLSLGESSPELLDRLKSLKCR